MSPLVADRWLVVGNAEAVFSWQYIQKSLTSDRARKVSMYVFIIMPPPPHPLLRPESTFLDMDLGLPRMPIFEFSMKLG